ncbi:MAG: DUF4097 family beta strand repeat-containing protein [Candidatus Omnitrophota bacterium]
MKAKIFSILPFLFGLFFFSACGHLMNKSSAVFISDQEPFNQQIQIPPNVRILEIHHDGGNVTVKGWDKPFLLIEGIKRVSAANAEEARLLLDSAQIIYYERAPNRLALEYKGISARKKNAPSEAIDYTINAPQSLIVEMTTRNGVISVSNLLTDVFIDHKTGDVKVEAVEGRVRIQSQDGQAIAVRTKKSVELDCRDANIKLDAIGGDVSIKHWNGQLVAAGIGGNVEIAGDRSSIDLQKVKGRLKIDNRDGDVVCTDFYEGIDINVKKGLLKLEPKIPVPRDYYCTVVDGELILRVLDSSEMLLEVEAENGRIHSDYPMPISAENNISFARGAINGGHRNVRLKVKNGAVSIQKAIVPPAAISEPAAKAPAQAPSTAVPAPLTPGGLVPAKVAP